MIQIESTDIALKPVPCNVGSLVMPDVIAIDPSLNGTAICVIHHGRLFAGLLGSKGKMGLDRLHHLRRSAGHLFDRFPGLPLVIEGYSMGSRDSHSHSLGEVGGAYKLEAFARGRRVYAPSPKTIKKFATGNGNAGKDLMLKEVFRRWGVDVTDNNIADAVAIALFFGYGRHIQQGLAVSLPQTHIEAITKAIKDGFFDGEVLAPRARSRALRKAG